MVKSLRCLGISNTSAAATVSLLVRSLQHFRSEQRSTTDDLTRNHEHAVTGIMQCFRMFGRLGDMRLHDFEDEEVILIDQRVVGEPAFVIGMTLCDERRLHMFCALRSTRV